MVYSGQVESSVSWKRKALGDPLPTCPLCHPAIEEEVGIVWHVECLERCLLCASLLHSGPNRAEIFCICCWLLSGEFDGI